MNSTANKIIGILSFNTEEGVISNLNNDLLSLKNKTIRGNVFTEYSAMISMRKYLKYYIVWTFLAYGRPIKYEELFKLLYSIPWNEVNFRDIYTIITNINTKIPKEQDDLSNIFKTSINTYLLDELSIVSNNQ